MTKPWKKWAAGALSLALLCGSWSSVSAWTDRTTPKTAEPAAKQESPALSLLENSLHPDAQENEKIRALIVLEEVVLADGSKPVPVEQRLTTEGMKAQLAYAGKRLDAFQKQAQQAGLDFSVSTRLDLALVGLGVEAQVKTLRELAKLPGVAGITEVTRYLAPEARVERRRRRSLTLPGPDRDEKNYSEYRGHGQVVAILDSGIDASHPAFKFTADAKSAYPNEAAMTARKEAVGLTRGVFLNDKIPYGYNYMDRNTELVDTNEGTGMHGQHVAGIIGANSEEFTGIAPDAQILAMRVFSQISGQTDDAIIGDAINDALKLGATSINLSLGKTAGTVSGINKTLATAIENASRMGALVNIAAGNEGQFGRGEQLPLAENPDYGVVGNPAVAPTSLAVASMERATTTYPAFVHAGETFAYKHVTSKLPFPTGKELSYVSAGTGAPEAYKSLQVSGKLALVERGGELGGKAMTFDDKLRAAEAAGAAGLLLYNHEQGGEGEVSPGLTDPKIPVLFLPRSIGLRLLQAREHGQPEVITFLDKEVVKNNPHAGRMSDFSSWGLSADGDLKPEITGYGGAIYSTLNNGRYGTMSGTSMATPKLTGAAALVLERLGKEFPQVTGLARSELLKALLMNTAIPHFDTETQAYTSPRKQGAGIVDINAALHSTTTLTEKSSGKPRALLGDLDGRSLHFEARLKNLSSKAKTYHASVALTTDEVKDAHFTLHPRALETKELGTVTLAPDGETPIAVDLDTSRYAAELKQQMPNGYYLEGHLILTSDTENTLTLPFVGFVGKWADLPVLEQPIDRLAAEGRLPFYYGKDGELPPEQRLQNFTHFRTNVNGKQAVLGWNEAASTPARPSLFPATLSPNGDGSNDALQFVGTFLRHFRDLRLEVFRASDTGRTDPYEIGTRIDAGPKNFYAGNPLMPRSWTDPTWAWSGYFKGVLTDGDYIFRVSLKGQLPTASVQTLELPVKVDTKKPVLRKASYDPATRRLVLSGIDATGSGIQEVRLVLPDGSGLEPDATADGSYSYTLPEGTDLAKATIEIADWGYNRLIDTVANATATGDFGAIHLNFKAPPQERLPKFSYRVLNSEGQEVKNLDRVPLGHYTIEITDIETGYRLAEGQSLSLELTTTSEPQEWNIAFDTIPSTTLWIQVEAPAAYPLDRIKLFLENVETGERIAVPETMLLRKTARVPYGRYRIVAEDVAEGYSFIAPGKPIECTTKYYEGKITVRYEAAPASLTVLASFDNSSTQEGLRFEIRNLTTGQLTQTEAAKPVSLPVGRYEVRALVRPEGFWLDPVRQEVELTAEAPKKEVTFAYREEDFASYAGTKRFDVKLWLDSSARSKLNRKQLQILDFAGNVYRFQNGFKNTLVDRAPVSDSKWSSVAPRLPAGEYSFRFVDEDQLINRGRESLVYKLNGQPIERLVIHENDAPYPAKEIQIYLATKEAQAIAVTGKTLVYTDNFITKLSPAASWKLKLTPEAGGDPVTFDYTYGTDTRVTAYPGKYRLEEVSASDPRYHLEPRSKTVELGLGTLELVFHRVPAPVIGYNKLPDLEAASEAEASEKLPKQAFIHLENADDIGVSKEDPSTGKSVYGTNMPLQNWTLKSSHKTTRPGADGASESVLELTYEAEIAPEERFSIPEDFRVSCRVLIANPPAEHPVTIHFPADLGDTASKLIPPLTLTLKLTPKAGGEPVLLKWVNGLPVALNLAPGEYIMTEVSTSDERYHLIPAEQSITVGSGNEALSIGVDRVAAPALSAEAVEEREVTDEAAAAASLPDEVFVFLDKAEDLGSARDSGFGLSVKVSRWELIASKPLPANAVNPAANSLRPADSAGNDGLVPKKELTFRAHLAEHKYISGLEKLEILGKVHILGKKDEPVRPSPDPVQPDPGTDPKPGPGVDPKPGTDPRPVPGTDPVPGISPTPGLKPAVSGPQAKASTAADTKTGDAVPKTGERSHAAASLALLSLALVLLGARKHLVTGRR